MKYVANIYFLFSGFFTARIFLEIALRSPFNVREYSINAAVFAIGFFIFQQWWPARRRKTHPDVHAKDA